MGGNGPEGKMSETEREYAANYRKLPLQARPFEPPLAAAHRARSASRNTQCIDAALLLLFFRRFIHAKSSRRMTTAETHSPGEHKALLRADFDSFAVHCFYELNTCTRAELAFRNHRGETGGGAQPTYISVG